MADFLGDQMFRNLGLDPADFTGAPILPARDPSDCALQRQDMLLDVMASIKSTVEQMMTMVEFHPDRDDLFGILDHELDQQLQAAGEALVMFRVIRDCEGEA